MKDEKEEEDPYSAAFLEYLAQAISYIYRWNNSASLDKDFDLSVKMAAIRILEMDERLTEVRKQKTSNRECVVFTF
jgi:uncharacterized protein involved in tolerance to divalent cations